MILSFSLYYSEIFIEGLAKSYFELESAQTGERVSQSVSLRHKSNSWFAQTLVSELMIVPYVYWSPLEDNQIINHHKRNGVPKLIVLKVSQFDEILAGCRSISVALEMKAKFVNIFLWRPSNHCRTLDGDDDDILSLST
uniref:Uncharacterized protein n=1 Tax=Glossina pallidipes TaxID=7398 RepID=A0A1A9ZT01_GLOPL